MWTGATARKRVPHLKASAKQSIVVIVFRCVVAHAPHGGPARWVHQTTMSAGGRQEAEPHDHRPQRHLCLRTFRSVVPAAGQLLYTRHCRLQVSSDWKMREASFTTKVWLVRLGVGKWGTLYPTSLFVNKDVRPRDRGQLLFRMPHSRRSAREDDADEPLNNIGIYVAKFRMQNSKKFSTHVMIWIVYMTIQLQIVGVFSSLLFLIFSHSTSIVS